MNVTETQSLFPAGVGALPSASGADGNQATADFQTFLTLLTAQLRNQDPMQPIDSTEFVAQLASFTSAEQLVGVNERLDSLQAQGIASEIAALGSWIGKDVAATDGSFRASGGPVAFSIPRSTTADQITARVVNKTGDEIASFQIDTPGADSGFWNGRDASGAFVRGEDLRIELTYSLGGTAIDQQPASVFRQVVAIRGSEGGIVLDLADGGTLNASLIAQLRDPQRPASPLPS